MARCSRAIISACLVSLRCLGSGTLLFAASGLAGFDVCCDAASRSTPMASSPAAVTIKAHAMAIAGLAPDGIAAADVRFDLFKQAFGDERLDHLVRRTALESGWQGQRQQRWPPGCGAENDQLRYRRAWSLVGWLLRACLNRRDRRLLRPRAPRHARGEGTHGELIRATRRVHLP